MVSNIWKAYDKGVVNASGFRGRRAAIYDLLYTIYAGALDGWINGLVIEA